ncbi:MAG: hypothetical protein DRG78_05945 [Epsilonproteobacteria bacterium]|nr:MAG: hypothetical protein DRG78_05945 [Campylobacterota bacterium]
MIDTFFTNFASMHIILTIILIAITFFIFSYVSSNNIIEEEINGHTIDPDSPEYKLYLEYLKDVNNRIVLNTDNYDKNILTLSTFLLGLSLIFIKDIIGENDPLFIEYIHASWEYLLTSILVVIISFVIGTKDNEISVKNFFMEAVLKKSEYSDKISIYNKILKYLSYLSGVFLFLGMLYLYLFVKANL